MAFFTIQDGRYVAGERAVSWWSPKQLDGPPVCALLARQLERHNPGIGFIPARLTVEMFKPVLNEPISLESEVVRQGRRVVAADASIVQHGEIRARANVAYLAITQEPPGEIWQPEPELPMPYSRLVSPEGEAPLFKSGDSEWSNDFAAAQDGARKVLWQNLPPLVDGEQISPFQRAAALGDTTNLVCHWGSEGMGYINTDMTVTLARLPKGVELGLQAQDHVAFDGVAVGTATLYDRFGRLGTCVVTALSNVRRQVDLAAASRA